VGAGEAVGTAGAAASFKVGAIFALQPAVGAVVAVGAFGGVWKVGIVETVSKAVGTFRAAASLRVGALSVLEQRVLSERSALVLEQLVPSVLLGAASVSVVQYCK
jgi:hypothetical protein